MKRVSFLLTVLVILSTQTFGQRNYWKTESLPFEMRTMKYDKVVAYDVKPSGQHKNLVYKQVRIDTTVIISKKELSKVQVDTLEKLITTSRETGVFTQLCVCPHFVIVYYLNNQMVGYFTSYFEENRFKFTVTKIEKGKTSEWYFYRSFNQQGRDRIAYLCTALGLNYCKAKP